MAFSRARPGCSEEAETEILHEARARVEIEIGFAIPSIIEREADSEWLELISALLLPRIRIEER
jgi:hypothetical protein